ncbi:hypothetical protein CK936_09300 [Streptomyces albireticuli]|uniref:Transposase n=1 Tax=Streptomyces albireticuli TaxID=1940 RepID=A0A2A2DCU4_9ACTN|nr:hypothetical protein CK936_09300 [Streptomyces albireticuli]
MEAARLSADGQSNGLVAKQLQVSVRSVQRWQRVYEAPPQSTSEGRVPAGEE